MHANIALSAKNGREHIKDFFSVLGVKGENSTKHNELKRCFIITCTSIDKYQNFYRSIKQQQNGRFKDFSFGKYGHRIFFHQGLEINKHKSLIKQVNKTDWDEATKQAFYRAVQNEWAARVRKIYNITKITFGLYDRKHHRQ